MVCVKCGFDQNPEGSASCEKCGAAQEKVKQLLKSKIDNLLVMGEELASLNRNTIEHIFVLKEELENNTENVDYGVLIDIKQKQENLSTEAKSLEKNIANLLNYTKSITTDFNASDKINKATKYCETYKDKAQFLNKEIKCLKDNFDKKEEAKKFENPAVDESFAFETKKEEMASFLETVDEIEADLAKERYPALITLSMLYKFMSYLVVAFVVLSCVVAAFTDKITIDVKVSIIASIIIAGGILAVTLMAVAESVKIGIDIENNTRATKKYLVEILQNSIKGK